MLKKAGEEEEQETQPEIREVKLDKKAQRALAYLSGIPPTEEESLTATLSISEEETSEFEHLLSIWLKLQKAEIKEIGKTLLEVIKRLKLGSKKIREKIESASYLMLVRKSFRNWSAAESEAKRILIRNLLVNAASRSTSPHQALLMFVDLIDRYSEEHFQVLKAIFAALPEGLTRKAIWMAINSERIPAEDSAEADMFKMLILDLSTGYLIRQPREKDYYGSFTRLKPPWAIVSQEPTTQRTSAFDDQVKYVLTEFGKQFVYYTMEEIPLQLPEEEQILPEESET